jgi:hypothetical protein
MHPLIAKTTGAQWIDGKRNPDFSLNTQDAVAEIIKNKPPLPLLQLLIIQLVALSQLKRFNSWPMQHNLLGDYL